MKPDEINWRKTLGPKPTYLHELWPSDDGAFFLYRPRFLGAKPWIKQELGGRWIGKHGAWRLPGLVNIAEKVIAMDPSARIHPGILDRIQLFRDPERFASVPNYPHPLFDKLYGFQREAVHHIVTSPYHGVLLTLSPGLGKTPTSVVAAGIMKARRILVVAPLTLLGNWEREVRRWSAAESLHIQHTHQREPVFLEEDPDTVQAWVITNYDTVRTRSELEWEDGKDGVERLRSASGAYYDTEWDMVIVDESVLLKNRATKRTKMMRQLAEQASRVLLLSGAPVVRDNSDAWGQLSVIQPGYFPSFWRFAKETCYVEEGEWGTVIEGSRLDKSLRNLYPELMFVRNQDEVLPDLPELIFQDLPVELTRRQRKAHDDLMTTWLHRLEDTEQAGVKVKVTAVVAELTRLQQVTSNLVNLRTTGEEWPEESAKADVIRDLLEAGGVEFPLLIWGHWKPGMEALNNRLLTMSAADGSPFQDRTVSLVHGDTPRDVADHTLESFKAGNLDVLILSLGTGKYGHTFTNAKTIIYHDKTTDSDAYFQSLHRVRRIGLTHTPRVISLRAPGTIDDFVEANLAGKLPSMANVTGAELSTLLRSLGEDWSAVLPPSYTTHTDQEERDA
jgi:SNF2 family DNA or RNA helicase